MPERIPLLDLVAQYQQIRDEVTEAIERVVRSQRFILGPEVAAFEEELAAYCHTSHCVGVSSGSDALLVTMMALGIGPGNEVITSAYSFFATAGAIARVGARPVFVDIDPVTYNLDPGAIEDRITTRTRAIIPVHLFGQCAEMGAVTEIAGRHDLHVIEDAAQAIGAEWNGRRCGGLGTAACFSFFPSKNLGGFGDSGAVTTNDPDLAERIRCLRTHGGRSEYEHDMIGGNFRLDALQAAVLRVKLTRLDFWTNSRRRNAAVYEQAFKASGLGSIVTTPQVVESRHVFNQYVISVEDRDALREHLAARGIESKVYYHVPLHLQSCFRPLGYQPGDLPQSEKAARSTIALPIYPELSGSQIRTVVEAVAEHYASLGRLDQRKAA